MHPRGGCEVNSLTQGAEVTNTPVILTAQREERGYKSRSTQGLRRQTQEAILHVAVGIGREGR